MRGQNLNLTVAVENKLSEEGGEMPVELRFDTLKDFAPESVARQVPEINKLLELREALTALKGPLGNVPAFRRRIQSIIGDEATREKLLGELKLEEEEGKKEGGGE